MSANEQVIGTITVKERKLSVDNILAGAMFSANLTYDVVFADTFWDDFTAIEFYAANNSYESAELCKFDRETNKLVLPYGVFVKDSFVCITMRGLKYSEESDKIMLSSEMLLLNVSKAVNIEDAVVTPDPTWEDKVQEIIRQMFEGVSVDPEQIKQAVNGYLEENPPSGMTAEQEQQLNKNTKDISSLSEEIINQAEVDDDGLVSFKNSQGLTLFTLDLSEFSGGGNVYGELVISTESLSINEGESGTFTVKLATAPTTNQIVYLALSDNTKLSITPSTLAFTPSDYDTEQTVTVTALEDEDSDDETITISLTSKKVSAKSLLVSIADDDIPLVEDGLTLYYNLRNGDLTDSVGGVVATNGGTIVDGGVKLESKNTKFQFVYPVKTENIPNGATVELALTGLADFQGGGNGYGTGYAYKNFFYDHEIGAGFAYTANGSIASSNFPFSVTESPNTFIDFATENHICFVYNADGSADVYFNGELFKTRDIPDGFEHYNASGNITFKIPYLDVGAYNSYPITLSEIRIYERALTSDEVKHNYDATVSHQETVNF